MVHRTVSIQKIKTRGLGITQIFTGPQLSEYLQVVCPNTTETCLKSVSKTHTFRFFRDFQPLKRLLHTSSQMANFGQFWPKWAKRDFSLKKHLEHFLQLIRAFNSEKKCSKRFFEKIPFCSFWPKLSKIGHLAGCVQQSL